MDSIVLWEEISTDPLERGYGGMSDAKVTTDMNTLYRSQTRDTLDSAEIYERIDVAEFQEKSPDAKVYVRDILGLGQGIFVGPGSKARTVLLAIFGGSSLTIQVLASALEVPISRAAELGLGTVKPGHVQDARTLGE